MIDGVDMDKVVVGRIRRWEHRSFKENPLEPTLMSVAIQCIQIDKPEMSDGEIFRTLLRTFIATKSVIYYQLQQPLKTIR